MYHLPCLVLLVLLVATAKNLCGKEVFVVDTKQSRKAGKAGGPDNFVVCSLFVITVPSEALTN